MTERLFTLNGSRPENEAVRAWLQGEPQDLRRVARHWFALIRQCGDDVRELLHDGCPVACVGDLPFAYVNTFTKHVNVGFFRGALLDDPEGLLQGQGRSLRHVKLLPDARIDSHALRGLIEAAYADIKACQSRR